MSWEAPRWHLFKPSIKKISIYSGVSLHLRPYFSLKQPNLNACYCSSSFTETCVEVAEVAFTCKLLVSHNHCIVLIHTVSKYSQRTVSRCFSASCTHSKGNRWDLWLLKLDKNLRAFGWATQSNTQWIFSVTFSPLTTLEIKSHLLVRSFSPQQFQLSQPFPVQCFQMLSMLFALHPLSLTLTQMVFVGTLHLQFQCEVPSSKKCLQSGECPGQTHFWIKSFLANLFSQAPWLMFPPVMHSHLSSLCVFEALVSHILQSSWSMPIPILQSHMLQLPVAKMYLAKTSRCLILLTELLQHSRAICPSQFPCFSHCWLKFIPNILQMSWTMQPVNAFWRSSPDWPYRIFKEGFQATTNSFKLFNATNLWSE